MTDIIEAQDLKFPTIEYGVTEAEIAEVAERYKDPDASTEEGYEHCKEGVQTLTSMRTAVETRRLDLKRPITKWIAENVDGRAKALVRQIRTAEGPVRAEKERIDEIKQAEARAAAEAEQARIDTIKDNISKIEATAREQHPSDTSSDYQQHITWLIELAITEEVFGEFVEDAKTARDASLYKLEQWHKLALEREQADKQRAEQQAELEAKQKELDKIAAKQQEEAERLEKEKSDAEERKAEEEKAVQEKAESEQRRKARDEENRICTIKSAIHVKATIPDRATNMSAHALDGLIEAEKDNKPDELIFQEFTAEAIQAWQQSLDRLGIMAAETRALEEQERLEEAAKMPDRDKLSNWFNALVTASACPEVGSKDAQKIVNRYGAELAKLTDNLRKAIAKL